jgi:hypothetical protein
LSEDWPDLPYDAWTDTRDTLHMYLQVLGKVRLALSPFEPQWAHVPLYVTARGLTTSPIPYGLSSFELDVDLIDHHVALRTSDGRGSRLALVPRPVAEFFAAVMSMLHAEGIDVQISPGPSEVADPIPFAEDNAHASYDPEWAHRFWRVLSQADLVMKEYRAPFRGKATPVHFFWGGLDLACTRFSGAPAQPHGEDIVQRLSSDAEQVTAGFWPGSATFPEPAFFSYTHPHPDGLEDARVRPADAVWDVAVGVFVLRYDDARRAPSPRQAIRDFLDSTYEAGARMRGWDQALVGPREARA